MEGILCFTLLFSIIFYIQHIQAFNFRLSQPQIYINDGNLYIAPAEHRNLVLVSNGTGKIIFNNVELNSLVYSIENSTRDLNSFKRIFGVPTNSTSAFTTRIGHLEQSFRRLDQIDGLDSRLIAVERQLAYNLSSSTDTSGDGRGSTLNGRFRRIRQRIETLENRMRNLGTSDRNPCRASVCRNGGTCIPTMYGAFCWCAPGWEGDRCQRDQDECNLYRGTDLGCQNGATCVNTPGSYRCDCRSGWMGIHCTKRSGDCSSGPPWELCGHGMCVNQHAGSRPFTCICDQGWKTDGTNPACNVDVDECNGPHVSCSKNPVVACINTPGSFHCGPCPAGYTGNGYYCSDINECLVNNGGCSFNPMVQCINTIGSRTCGECPAGYIGNGINCQYVGMCQISNGGCHPMARCVQNPVIGQSFVQCICPAGYTGTGMGLHGCFPYSGTAVSPPGGQTTNPCSTNPCLHGTCLPVGNHFTCTCLPGFTGPTCGIRIDPCMPNPCNNGGTCVTTVSGYVCRCTNDFTGDLCESQEESCGGTLATTEGSLRYPHSSSETYNHNQECVWIIQTTQGKTLNLTFTSFHLEGSSSCNLDFLEIFDGASGDSPSMGRFCGIELPRGGSLNSTHSALRLKFQSDGSIAGLGFALTWNTTDPYCGGAITDSTHGALSSPGYPGQYPASRDCYWTISVSLGKRIQLVFASMRLETHPNCSYDYLQILDGIEETAHQLAIFCNTTLPPPIISTGPHLTLRFHTDASQSDTGFHVTYAQVPGVPGCGGVLTGPVGVFSSPHHPEPYAHYLDCEWLIRLPPLETITLEFLSFEIENAHNCRYDYVEVREGTGPDGYLVGRYCGRNVPAPYRSAANNLFIRFHSDESVAYGGFRIKYEAACGGTFTSVSDIIRSPYYPGNYPSNRDCTFIISQPVGKAIRLDFFDFDIESAVDTRCLFDFLEVRDGDNENSTLIGHYCGANGPESILSSLNFLWLRFKTDGSVQNRGFMANFTAIDLGCGGIFKGNRMGVIQSPRHPEVYPHGVNCKWIIRGEPGEIIRITWATFSLEANARCRFDSVEIFDNSTMFDVGHTMGKFCGETLPPTITSSDFTITMIFKSDHSVAHDGFMASFVILNATNSCGGNYLTQYGTLKSPGYPNRYPNRKVCVWTIKVPAGQQIRLNITDFDLENGTSRGCIYDYLEIRNGGQDTSPLIGKFCNNQRPPSIIPSFTNALYLKFYSDISRTFQGFQAIWDGTSTGCGGNLVGVTQGSITSPNYPQHYGIRTECIWTITINPGSVIQLTFVDLDIQNSPTCYGEHVELRDGSTRNGQLIGKYCYSETVVVINSTSNVLRLKYVSYFGGSGRGFRATFQTLCNRIITGFGSVIESPNFPRRYPHNRNCTWEIRAPLGNMVNLSFSHFSVEGPRRNNCTYDFVEISEKARNAEPVTRIGRYCGENAPSLVSSTKDTVFVHFKSDSSLAFNGFRLEWILSGCGGRMIGPWGRLQSPNYPRHYPLSVQCVWHITTEIGTNVQLNVWDLDVEHADGCRYDYLRVYGGSDETSAMLTEVCQKLSSSMRIASHGNNMYVVFHSDYIVAGRGFAASYSQIPGGCGGRFNSPQGTIYSPNWPQNYDHDDDCSWIITVDRNHVVQLQFTEFAIETHINCSYDHVAVYDGRTINAPQLLMHCGTTLPNPPIITATGNKLLIRLKTDGSAAAKGFSAKYSTACGARLSNRYGQISTLETSKTLLQSTNCTWIIAGTSPDDHVTLTFTYMDIHAYNANSTDCNWNYVEVLDGQDEEAPSIGKYCFGTTPPALTSQGNAFVVRYKPAGGLGHGFRATYEISSSACGGELVSMQGSFTSPNYPNGYPMNTECIWNVKASPGNRVQLSFRRMAIESSDFCNSDFVEIHENSASGRLLGHYCGNEIPANVTAGNNLWILFRSDGEGQAPGFWADYSLSHGNELNGTSGDIASPLWPHPGTYAGEFYWRITVNEGMVIQITFSEFEVGYNAPNTQTCSKRTSEFKVFDGYDTSAPVILSKCDQILPDPLTSSGNVVYLIFRKQNMFANLLFKLRWTAIPPPDITTSLYSGNITGCGGNFTIGPGNSSTLTSPNYPEYYPHNMRCEWFIFTDQHYRLKLKVEDIELESHWSCLYDKVEIYDGKFSEPNYELNSTLCQRAQRGQIFYSSGRTMKIVMITDSSQSSTGFNFTLSTECGGFMKTTTGELGRITSPNFGVANYAHSNCTWVVMVRPGRTIRVTFTDMDIYAPSQGSCSTDSLILRNGGHADSPFLGQGRYCGNTRPAILETGANQLFVKFIAYTSGGRGFALNYNEISASCGGQIHLTHEVRQFELSSPNFPNLPPPFTECEWVFTVPPNEAVQIDFQLNFEVQTSRRCEMAGVEIRDGGTRLSPVINTFCGSMPGTQKSTGNNLYMRYYTSVSEPKPGFKAKASIARCGGTFVGWRGTIVSNGYPTSYDINLDCMWTIKGPEGSYLILNFIDLELNAPSSRSSGSSGDIVLGGGSSGSDSNCTQDRVLITEENISGIENPRNWTFCQRSNGFLPSRVETSTNQVHIRFLSDNLSETAKGFKLSYRAATERCGGTLTQPSGFIQSPGYPRGYSHYRGCYWTIRAPPGRRIRLEFLDFDLEAKILTSTNEYCVDFVSLRQSQESGYTYRSAVEFLYNGTLCGSQLPPPVETTSSTLYIVFRTDRSIAHRGFKASYTTDDPVVCGGTIEEQNVFGSLASPSETTNTPNTTTTMHCNWVKNGEGSNGTTIITLNSVNLPQRGQSDTSSASVPCTAGGFLRISPPSEWSYPWKKFCGFINNQKFYLPGSTFTALYQAYNVSSSFNLTYQISPCGGSVSGPMSNITTPNFPNAYPANIECIWVLEYPNYGSQIKLIFADLDLDDSTNSDGCDKDFVVVRNGKYPTSPLLGKYCGSNIPTPIISMSRSLWIEFHSDSNPNPNKRGFRIESQSVPKGCGGVLHTKYGSVSSPKIPGENSLVVLNNQINNKYPHNTECEWLIETIPGYMLNFQFSGRFDIENSTNCANDYVELFTMNQTEWKSLGKFCGKQLPSAINTTSTKGRILFHSNEAINGDGFRVNWYSPCGGVYSDTEGEGEIRSAHFDRYAHSFSVNNYGFWYGNGWERTHAVQQCDYIIQANSSDTYVVGEFLEPFQVAAPILTSGILTDASGGEIRCPTVNVSVWTYNRGRRYGGLYCGEQIPPAFIAQGSVTISYNYLATLENYGFRLRYNTYKCGGLITQPTTIRSPGHPFTSAPNMNCTWVVKAPSNKVVRLKFEQLELEYHPNCQYDAVLVYDGPLINDEKKVASYCGNLTNDLRRISSPSDSMTVQFVTDWSIQHSGFVAAIDFTLGQAQNCGGTINITAGGSHNLQNPDGDNDGKYDVDLQCDYLIKGGDFQMIELQFTSFNLEGSRRQGASSTDNDLCPYDYIEVRDGPGPFSDLLGKFCSNTLPPRIVSSTNFLWFSFVTDGSYNFPGYRATVFSRPSPCGASFSLNATRQSQTLTSPNYAVGNTYPNSLRCRWIIDGASATDEVDVSFKDLDIESSAECGNDRLQIRDVSTSYISKDGISGPVIFNGVRARDWRYTQLNIDLATIMQDVLYCGTQMPPDFFSVGRSVEVIFHSDAARAGRGFQIEYKAAGCNRTYTNVQGRIFSPEWPTYSPMFSNCFFTVNAPNGSFVSLYFNEFLLPESTSCLESAFEARENNQNGRVLGRYCGSALPSPIFSTTSSIWVQYFTRYQQSRGYDMTYVTSSNGVGCGGDVFHTSGSLTSPFYPNNYTLDAACTWRIRVPAAMKLQFDFTTFLIVGNCDYNFLEISSMNSHALNEDPLLITKYCSGDTPARYIGTTDMAMLRYKSSVNNTGNGWRIQFRGTV